METDGEMDRERETAINRKMRYGRRCVWRSSIDDGEIDWDD